MLVISGKPSEVIVLPQCGLRVTVIAVEGNEVQLGFVAPDEFDLYREEMRNSATANDPIAFLEDLTAELTSTAYTVMIRHGGGDNWLDLQLDLWKSLGETVRSYARPAATRPLAQLVTTP